MRNFCCNQLCFLPFKSRKLGPLVVSAILATLCQSATAGVVGDTATSMGQSLVRFGSPNTAGATTPMPPAPSVAPISPCTAAADQLGARNSAVNEASAVVAASPSPSMQTCLDQYKNFNMGGSLGYPDLTGLLMQAANQVCSAAQMKMQPGVGLVNQGLPLPGGVGRINSNAAFGGGSASGAGVSIGSGGVSQTGGSGNVLQSGGSGYSVPPLWK